MNPCEQIVTLPNWQWVRGMMSTDGKIFVEHADCGEAAWLWVAEDGCEWEPIEGKFPDLSDPPTAALVTSLTEKYTGQAVWYEPSPTSGWIAYTILAKEDTVILKKSLCVAPTKEKVIYGALENVL